MNGFDFDLVIVGGGFSGVCTAWRLLVHERLPANFRLAIVEPDERLGAGLAYGTESPHHLLNVRTRGMSISSDDPSSFVRWLSVHAPEFGPDDFAPRGLFCRYINSCLEDAASGRPAGTMTILRDEVISLEPRGDSGGYDLTLRSGGAVSAGTVVLAIGNLPPRSPLDGNLLRPTWRQTLDYSSIETLAIVGTGLTAMDIILDAEARRFAGTYLLISSHGQFPQCHREPFDPIPEQLRTWAAELAMSRPRLLAALRSFRLKRKTGWHWEQLVDAMRVFSPVIWRGFNSREKRIFLRRLRSRWNTHLHRTCERSHRVITSLIDSGRLKLVNSRVVEVESLDGAGGGVRLLLRSGASVDADLAINATGLFSSIRDTDSPLMAQLLDDRLVHPDEFCLGIRVNSIGQPLAADGMPWPGLFTVGALRRGEELECTAVPEIRRQVAAVAEAIVRNPAEADRNF